MLVTSVCVLGSGMAVGTRVHGKSVRPPARKAEELNKLKEISQRIDLAGTLPLSVRAAWRAQFQKAKVSKRSFWAPLRGG